MDEILGPMIDRELIPRGVDQDFQTHINPPPDAAATATAHPPLHFFTYEKDIIFGIMDEDKNGRI